MSQLVRRGSRKASMAAGALLKQLQVRVSCMSATSPHVSQEMVHDEALAGWVANVCHTLLDSGLVTVTTQVS